MLSSRAWHEETAALRGVLGSFALTEEIKWCKPCYTLGGKNVALIQGFNEYIAVLFFQGALLQDRQRLLVAPGPNTQTSRQLRFRSLHEIAAAVPVLRAYIAEAIEIQRAGKRLPRSTPATAELPAELTAAFAASPVLRKAFYALTPGRQRAYLLHFNAAKQSATRTARIEKHRDQILAGLGWNERH
jgi:uncharacterized protein YdeI (YjbR/CyaY-like superfamily)